MKLKPSLFQLIVVLMTSSLIVSCIPQQKGTQVDCNNPAFKQSQDCNSSSGSSGSLGIYQRSGNSNGEASSQRSTQQKNGRANSSGSKSGRGGFGSFGRGSSGS